MKIANLNLNQLNQQLERIDELHKRLSLAETQLKTIAFQTAQIDFIHARPTFNNVTFTWTGATGTISWTKGWIRDKNAVVDTGIAFSEAPSFQFKTSYPKGLSHNIAISAGSIGSLTPNAYYWFGWNLTNNTMYALQDITKLYSHHDMQVICQLYTGTAGQSGTAGGGGSQGGSDLSGARYKLF